LIAPLPKPRQTGNCARDIAVGDEAVDEEDLEPRRKAPKLRDLAPLAVAELETYITELKDEIVRVENEIAAKRKQRGGAESLFKR